MARISTYANDSDIRSNDRLLGTDGGTGQAGSGGSTKNFSIASLTSYLNSNLTVTAAPGAYETSLPAAESTLALHTVNVLLQGGNYALPSTPDDGSWIRISQILPPSQTVVLTNAPRVMNDDITNGNLTINNRTTAFELVYVAKIPSGSSSPVGWVFVGASGDER